MNASPGATQSGEAFGIQTCWTTSQTKRSLWPSQCRFCALAKIHWNLNTEWNHIKIYIYIYIKIILYSLLGWTLELFPAFWTFLGRNGSFKDVFQPSTTSTREVAQSFEGLTALTGCQMERGLFLFSSFVHHPFAFTQGLNYPNISIKIL